MLLVSRLVTICHISSMAGRVLNSCFWVLIGILQQIIYDRSLLVLFAYHKSYSSVYFPVCFPLISCSIPVVRMFPPRVIIDHLLAYELGHRGMRVVHTGTLRTGAGGNDYRILVSAYQRCLLYRRCPCYLALFRRVLFEYPLQPSDFYQRRTLTDYRQVLAFL